MKKQIILSAVAAGLMLTLTACGSKEQAQEEEMYSVKYSATTVNPKENKRVLIISASPRRDGNTNTLANEFARGAEEAGGRVINIFLGDYDIKFFQEENQQLTGDRAVQDDAEMIVREMVNADVIVLASPVYFLNIDGQMKTLIDRSFSHFMEIRDKEFYYITACADPYESTADYAIEGFRGFTKCIPNATERGYVKAIGMGAKAVKGSPYMEQAYQLGLSINK